jgi:hypothetical protein
MTILMMGLSQPLPQEPLPVQPHNKTWVMNRIKSKAPIGKFPYEWWLDFFETILRESWDA